LSPDIANDFGTAIAQGVGAAIAFPPTTIGAIASLLDSLRSADAKIGVIKLLM